jgi:hypothetical protein
LWMAAIIRLPQTAGLSFGRSPPSPT